MGSQQASPGGGGTASCTPRPLTISVQALVERLRNDRYEVTSKRAEAENDFRRIWNSAIEHVLETVVPELVARGRIEIGLEEIEEVTRG